MHNEEKVEGFFVVIAALLCLFFVPGVSAITSVIIGKSVKKIGKKAFHGCKKLKKVKITANRSLKIEKGAFSKIGKGAKITLKGVKGKAKKKLFDKING